MGGFSIESLIKVIAKRLSAIFWRNRSDCDTSMKFGIYIVEGVIFKFEPLATSIYSKIKDGRHLQNGRHFRHLLPLDL